MRTQKTGKRNPLGINRKVSPIGTMTLQGLARRAERDKYKPGKMLKRKTKNLTDLYKNVL